MGEPRLTFGRLSATIAVASVVGIPLVAYLWETANRTVAGYIEPARLLLALPVPAVFLFYLRYLARLLVRWERHELR
jgi:hypothetical protein